MIEANAEPAVEPRARYSALIWVVTAALVGVLIGMALTSTAAVAGITRSSTAISIAIPIVKVLLDLAAAVTVGSALLSVLIGYERSHLTEPTLAIARRTMTAGAVVWTVAAIILLVLQTADFHPTTDSIGLSEVSDYITRIGEGKALLLVAVLAMLLAVLGIVTIRVGETVPVELRIGLGLFTVLPLPTTGHASDSSLHDYTMISIELHVLSVVTWCGGLLAILALLTANRTLLASALPRFSKLATACLLITAATGLFNGVVTISNNPNFGFIAGIFGTGYGQLVLLKTACIVAIAALAAHTRWRLLPGIAEREPTAVAMWAGLEVTVMGLAFGLAAALARAPVS